jgi:predicted NAD/FAD-binding protein
MVRAFGTLAVVGAGVIGFWVGYILDARRNPVELFEGEPAMAA